MSHHRGDQHHDRRGSCGRTFLEITPHSQAKNAELSSVGYEKSNNHHNLDPAAEGAERRARGRVRTALAHLAASSPSPRTSAAQWSTCRGWTPWRGRAWPWRAARKHHTLRRRRSLAATDRALRQPRTAASRAALPRAAPVSPLLPTYRP